MSLVEVDLSETSRMSERTLGVELQSVNVSEVVDDDLVQSKVAIE